MVCGIYKKINQSKKVYMSLDVDIYMNNILKFFRENPKELLNLVPQQKEKEFYEKIREIALVNEKKGDDVALTKKQLIDVCKDLNTKKTIDEIAEKVIYHTPFGSFSLN